MPIVLDASITLEWSFQDEATPATEAIFDRVRDDGAIVPAIWAAEVANGLLVGERRQRLSGAAIERFIATLEALPITIDRAAPDVTWGSVLALARQQGLTVYDACYLELAARSGVPLATRDDRMRVAATRLGVDLA